MRVLAVLTNLVPYHLCRWNAVVEAGHAVTVIQRRRGDSFSVLETSDAAASFMLHTLSAHSNSPLALVDELRTLIVQASPDVVVVSGWSASESLAALLVAAQLSLPIVVCSESNRHDAPRRPWGEWVKARLLRYTQAALVGGSSHRSYLLSLGMGSAAIFTGYDVVDNAHFASARHWRVLDHPSPPCTLDGRVDGPPLPLPPRFLLAVSRFTSKKNLRRLIEGFGLWLSSDAMNTDSQLLILGDGPLRTELEAWTTSLGLAGLVQLPGACTYGQLPLAYGCADGFIHASTVEQWGLVVNEAMAAGLPVLVSRTCGCAPDLVRDLENGCLFDPARPSAIASAIGWLMSLSPAERQRLGDDSRRIIDDFGPPAFASGLLSAAVHAIRSSILPLTWVDRSLILQLLARPDPNR